VSRRAPFDATADRSRELAALLNELIERPHERDEIEHRIEDRFSQTQAVMVLDMSGFSRTMQIRGVVPYLLMIHQMRLLAAPVVERLRGSVVTAEADNLFCVFDTVQDAIAASRRIMETLDSANLLLADDLELYASIGIGYGSILVMDEHHVAGTEVNYAAKLGEDVANRKEILLTTSARAELRQSDDPVERRRIDLAGIELEYYELR
jgi:adenylate cyclase